MAYKSSYGYGRRSYAPRPGRVTRPNRRPGECRKCGIEIPAYGGQLWRNADGTWSVVHHEPTAAPTGPWDRAPIRGGCPESTDAENARLVAGGFVNAPSETESARIARVAAELAAKAADEAPQRSSRAYARTSSGARLSNRYGRCEDAPCCGCCD